MNVPDGVRQSLETNMLCPSCGKPFLTFSRALRTFSRRIPCGSCAILLERGEVPWHHGLGTLSVLLFLCGCCLSLMDLVLESDSGWMVAGIIAFWCGWLGMAWTSVAWLRTRTPQRPASSEPLRGWSRWWIAPPLALLSLGLLGLMMPDAPLDPPKTLVVVAKSDLAPGTELRVDHLAKLESLTAALPTDAVLPRQVAELVGQRLRVPKAAGAILCWPDLERAIDPLAVGIVELVAVSDPPADAPQRPTAASSDAGAPTLDEAREIAREVRAAVERGFVCLGDLVPLFVRARRAEGALAASAQAPDPEWLAAHRDGARLEQTIDGLELRLTREFWRCHRLSRPEPALEALQTLLRLYPFDSRDTPDKGRKYLLLLERFQVAHRDVGPRVDATATSPASGPGAAGPSVGLVARTHLLPGEFLHTCDVAGDAADPGLAHALGSRLKVARHPGEPLQPEDLEFPVESPRDSRREGGK